MRKKIIRAFLGVYLAVCICYGVVRGITAPAMAEDVEVLEAPIPQTTAEIVSTPSPALAETPAPEVSPEPAASGETSYSGRSRGKHGGRGRSNTAEYAYTAPVSTPAPAPVIETETETEDEDEEKEKQSDDVDAPAAIPTLEDYLRGLHCGGCGRNCFLLNPRCMRGARKESQAETAYYELYGEAAGDGVYSS